MFLLALFHISNYKNMLWFFEKNMYLNATKKIQFYLVTNVIVREQ